jgi:hypothetical protein
VVISLLIIAVRESATASVFLDRHSVGFIFVDVRYSVVGLFLCDGRRFPMVSVFMNATDTFYVYPYGPKNSEEMLNYFCSIVRILTYKITFYVCVFDDVVEGFSRKAGYENSS